MSTRFLCLLTSPPACSRPPLTSEGQEQLLLSTGLSALTLLDAVTKLRLQQGPCVGHGVALGGYLLAFPRHFKLFTPEVPKCIQVCKMMSQGPCAHLMPVSQSNPPKTQGKPGVVPAMGPLLC